MGFAGDKLADWAKKDNYHVCTFKKEAATTGKFKVSAKRWIVERTFGWFGRYRRLAKDYETNLQVSELLINLVMIIVMLNRLF